MSCSRSNPCEGVLRVVLVTEDFILEECGCAHSYRTEAPGVAPERGRFAHIRGTYQARVPLPTGWAPRVATCRWCAQTAGPACAGHGGPDQRTRQAWWREMRRKLTGIPVRAGA